MKSMFGVLALVAAIAMLAGGCSDSSNPVGVQPAGHSDLQPLDLPSPAVPTFTTTLIAGQATPVGQVTCWLDQNTLNVRYATEGGWLLGKTHLIVVGQLGDIPVTAVGNPKVGHFPLYTEHDPAVVEYTYPVDLDALGLAEAADLVLAAHAEVALTDETGEIVQQEGAWAEGEAFPNIWTNRNPGFKDGHGNPAPQRGNWAMYFTVNMAELRGLLLWNKLGSDEEVANSEVGPDGVIVGDLEYLPCVHDNGFRPMPRTGDHNIPDNFIDFPDLNLGQQGCIEFWMHPDWDNYLVGHVVNIYMYGVADVANYAIAMGFNDWQNLSEVANRYNDGVINESVTVKFRPYQISEWSTTQPFHVAYVWDGTEPAIADRARLYFNGIDVTTIGGWFESTGDPTFDKMPVGAVLRMAGRLCGGDWDRHHWESNNQIIDNLKVWNYPKTDFSDRFTE